MRTLTPQPPSGRSCHEPRPTNRGCGSSRSLVGRKTRSVVRGHEAAGVGLAFPEMRGLCIQKFQSASVLTSSASPFRRLVARRSLEPITEFPRREFTEFDTPAANLLTNCDNCHRCSPGGEFRVPAAILDL